MEGAFWFADALFGSGVPHSIIIVESGVFFVGVYHFTTMRGFLEVPPPPPKMSRFGRNGDWEKAIELLEEMRNDGVQPDLVSYSTVLAAVGGHCNTCIASLKQGFVVMRYGQLLWGAIRRFTWLVVCWKGHASVEAYHILRCLTFFCDWSGFVPVLYCCRPLLFLAELFRADRT